MRSLFWFNDASATFLIRSCMIDRPTCRKDKVSYVHKNGVEGKFANNE